MTLSPELLAMIADEPAATDEELERWETWISHYCRTQDTFPCSVAGFHSLIARIVAERKVVDDAHRYIAEHGLYAPEAALSALEERG